MSNTVSKSAMWKQSLGRETRGSWSSKDKHDLKCNFRSHQHIDRSYRKMTQKDAVKGYQTITLKKAGNTQCGIFSHVCPHTAIISVILLTVYIVYAKYEEKKLSGTLKCNQPRKLNDLQKRALKCLKQTPKIKVPKANHRFSCPPSRYTFLKKKKKDSGCTDFRCCVRAFSSCGKQGLLFTLVHRRLIAVASPVAEYRL